MYVLTLNRAGLDDATLSQLVAELPRRCIALIEDIDAAFHQGATRRASDEENTGERVKGTLASQGKGEDTKSEAQCRVSLSGLLNALDGIGAQDGRLLFATTNHYGILDPALIRPGRMDLHIEFKLASKDQAKRLFRRFYTVRKDGGDEDNAVRVGAREPDIEEDCIIITPPLSPKYPEEATMHEKHITTTVVSVPNGGLPSHQPLEDAFADAIPDRRLSMASIQGFLMLHEDPCNALSNVATWVQEQILSIAPPTQEVLWRLVDSNRSKEGPVLSNTQCLL